MSIFTRSRRSRAAPAAQPSKVSSGAVAIDLAVAELRAHAGVEGPVARVAAQLDRALRLPQRGPHDVDRQVVALGGRADGGRGVLGGLERDDAPAAAEVAQPAGGGQRVHADVRADVDHDVARPQLGLDQGEEPGLVGAGEVEGALEVVAQVEVEAQAAAAGADARRPPPTTPRAPSRGRASGRASGGRPGTRPSRSRAACGRRGASRPPRRRARSAARAAARRARAVPTGSAAARCRASAGAPHADDAVPGHELAQARGSGRRTRSRGQ